MAWSSSSSLFVEREPLATDVINHLLQPTTDPRYKRSIILEGSPKAGKSWLLNHIRDRCLAVPTPPIVLFITSQDFSSPFSEPEELFFPVVDRLWKGAGTHLYALSLHLPARTIDIKSDLMTLAANHLAQTDPPTYLLILFDGMEEVKELSDQKVKSNERLRQVDLLYRFETAFIAPLLKYENVRLLASRRANSMAQWRTFTVKSRTELRQLGDFDLVEEQFRRLQKKDSASGK